MKSYSYVAQLKGGIYDHSTWVIATGKATQYPSGVFLYNAKVHKNHQKLPQCEQEWKNFFVHQSIFLGLFEVEQMLLRVVSFCRLAIGILGHISRLSGWEGGQYGTVWLVEKLMN